MDTVAITTLRITTKATMAVATVALALVAFLLRQLWSALPLQSQATATEIAEAALAVADTVDDISITKAHVQVTDFMNVGVGPVRTGIFNVADIGVMFGAAVLALCLYKNPDLQHDESAHNRG